MLNYWRRLLGRCVHGKTSLDLKPKEGAGPGSAVKQCIRETLINYTCRLFNISTTRVVSTLQFEYS